MYMLRTTFVNGFISFADGLANLPVEFCICAHLRWFLRPRFSKISIGKMCSLSCLNGSIELPKVLKFALNFAICCGDLFAFTFTFVFTRE